MKSEIPKVFIRTTVIPTTLNGKVNVSDVVKIIENELKGKTNE